MKAQRLRGLSARLRGFAALCCAVVFSHGAEAAEGAGAAPSEAAEAATALEEVVVRAEASVAASQGAVGSMATVAADDIALVRANHPHEVFVRVPGVWISRGSGHEHLTAIRSGVLAGPGACGEFLLLENGIPIRPAGFCNVNNLFEMSTEQAAAIEVVRGPASALFGGNALHGVVNVVTAAPANGWRGSVEVGPYEYAQGRLVGGGARGGIALLATSSAGYRDDTGYGQHKVALNHVGAVGGWRAATTAVATSLNQETGGFVRGFEAYDSPLRRSNPNPEAYRDAWSGRIGSALRRDFAERRFLIVTPYARRSAMTFLQHWLPGQPLEHNAQESLGAMLSLRSEGDLRWTAGVVGEAFAAELVERQRLPTRGSAFLVATRPAGTHYDYRVDGFTTAVFYDLSAALAGDWELVASGRAERNVYDYDNRHRDGNTRDDGTRCGFGGCLYTRPADRRDAFTNFAGRLGANWSRSPGATLYAVLGQGFRPPQTTELYRLQSGQSVAALDSETLRSVEVGWRGSFGAFFGHVALYAHETENLIFRDADGFNVSAGATDSAGVEAQARWSGERHAFDIVLSHARHRYAFTRAASRGERIVEGNMVDTAPRWLGSARWRWQGAAVRSEFELTRIGSHFVDAANTARYGGHTLANWRGYWQATRRLRVFARLINLFDTAYADRADYAFGSYRYFPGLPRQAYIGIEGAIAEGG